MVTTLLQMPDLKKKIKLKGTETEGVRLVVEWHLLLQFRLLLLCIINNVPLCIEAQRCMYLF